MKWIFVMTVILGGLTAGCSHYTGSPYGSVWDLRNTPCDATPPNQPGCYNKATGPGLINSLLEG